MPVCIVVGDDIGVSGSISIGDTRATTYFEVVCHVPIVIDELLWNDTFACFASELLDR
jgi:hypothetical protein